MGKIVTPKYRVEYRDNLAPARFQVQAWNGRTSNTRLEDWRRAMNASFQSGGSNEHVSKAFNSVPHIFYARIVRQSDDTVMCEAKAPTFEVA